VSADSKTNEATTMASNVGMVGFKPGERVRHADFGEGVIIATSVDGFIKVFFPSGERQVPIAGLTSIFSPIHLAFALPRKSIKKYIFPLFHCCGVGARSFELQGFNGPSGITLNTQTELFAFLRRQGFVDPTRVINRVHH
jgi:hypothetical protein